MLALTRKISETVVLTIPPSNTETKVIVKVVMADAQKVRLGFEAPREVIIVREELLNRPSEQSFRR